MSSCGQLLTVKTCISWRAVSRLHSSEESIIRLLHKSINNKLVNNEIINNTIINNKIINNKI